MLRAEHSILQYCKADALGQNDITNLSESDDEDDTGGNSPTDHNADEAYLPPPSDSPSCDYGDSSEPGSEPEEDFSISSIRAQGKAMTSRIRGIERLLGTLRAEHADFERREADAAERIGTAWDKLDQHGITEFSESDDEADVEGYNPTYHNDEAHFPPSSDLPSFDACDSSDSDSDSEEYPHTAVSQILPAGGFAAIKGADTAGHWGVHQMHSKAIPSQGAVSQISPAGAFATIKGEDTAGHWGAHQMHSKAIPSQGSSSLWHGSGRNLHLSV